jgi:flavin reductase
MSWSDQHEDMAGAFAAASVVKSVDPAKFRAAMSRLGAAVHVVTTDGPAGKTGFTATAIVSVSDEPATLLVCLNRAAISMPILRENGVFCVNTLRAGDEALADTFAGRTQVPRAERFSAGQWSTLSTGSPALLSAVISLDCRVAEVKSVASHDIYFGIVEAIHSGPPGPVLVYHDRAYKQV